jgi:hypothetical protein
VKRDSFLPAAALSASVTIAFAAFGLIAVLIPRATQVGAGAWSLQRVLAVASSLGVVACIALVFPSRSFGRRVVASVIGLGVGLVAAVLSGSVASIASIFLLNEWSTGVVTVVGWLALSVWATAVAYRQKDWGTFRALGAVTSLAALVLGIAGWFLVSIALAPTNPGQFDARITISSGPLMALVFGFVGGFFGKVVLDAGLLVDPMTAEEDAEFEVHTGHLSVAIEVVPDTEPETASAPQPEPAPELVPEAAPRPAPAPAPEPVPTADASDPVPAAKKRPAAKKKATAAKKQTAALDSPTPPAAEQPDPGEAIAEQPSAKPAAKKKPSASKKPSTKKTAVAEDSGAEKKPAAKKKTASAKPKSSAKDVGAGSAAEKPPAKKAAAKAASASPKAKPKVAAPKEPEASAKRGRKASE